MQSSPGDLHFSERTQRVGMTRVRLEGLKTQTFPEMGNEASPEACISKRRELSEAARGVPHAVLHFFLPRTLTLNVDQGE